jgi:hypothetical protein
MSIKADIYRFQMSAFVGPTSHNTASAPLFASPARTGIKWPRSIYYTFA